VVQDVATPRIELACTRKGAVLTTLRELVEYDPSPQQAECNPQDEECRPQSDFQGSLLLLTVDRDEKSLEGKRLLRTAGTAPRWARCGTWTNRLNCCNHWVRIHVCGCAEAACKSRHQIEDRSFVNRGRMRLFGAVINHGCLVKRGALARRDAGPPGKVRSLEERA